MFEFDSFTEWLVQDLKSMLKERNHARGLQERDNKECGDDCLDLGQVCYALNPADRYSSN